MNRADRYTMNNLYLNIPITNESELVVYQFLSDLLTQELNQLAGSLTVCQGRAFGKRHRTSYEEAEGSYAEGKRLMGQCFRICMCPNHIGDCYIYELALTEILRSPCPYCNHEPKRVGTQHCYVPTLLSKSTILVQQRCSNNSIGNLPIFINYWPAVNINI
jgi:hypothetical protein